MASVRDYIKIDPTEKRNKALGVIFPFNAEAVFYSSYTTKEQVKSNLLNVLLTEPGERILKPNFGVGLRNYLFENTSNIESLQNRIKMVYKSIANKKFLEEWNNIFDDLPNKKLNELKLLNYKIHRSFFINI